MRFQPKSEKELAADGLWPAGEYPFEVIEAEDTVSQKSGADMVKLTINVFNDDGKSRRVYDYLVGTPGGQFKVRGFAAATGLIDQYESGEMEAIDMQGRTGKCKIKIDKGDGSFPEKNAIATYVAGPVTVGSVAKKTARAAGGGSQDLDDAIPFSACWQ